MTAGTLARDRDDPGGAELCEGLGELVAPPLIVLGQFPVAATACSQLNPGLRLAIKPDPHPRPFIEGRPFSVARAMPLESRGP